MRHRHPTAHCRRGLKVSDDLVQSALTHGATTLAGAGGVGALMRWLAGKESEQVATRLALMEQKLDQLVAASEKTASLAERVIEARRGPLVAGQALDLLLADLGPVDE